MPLGLLLRSLGLKYHFYADETQIYIHSEPGDYTTIAFLERCVSEIKVWMAQNYLCLNSEKTEVMLIGSSNQLRKAGYATINIDGSVL